MLLFAFGTCRGWYGMIGVIRPSLCDDTEIFVFFLFDCFAGHQTGSLKWVTMIDGETSCLLKFLCT